MGTLTLEGYCADRVNARPVLGYTGYTEIYSNQDIQRTQSMGTTTVTVILPPVGSSLLTIAPGVPTCPQPLFPAFLFVFACLSFSEHLRSLLTLFSLYFLAVTFTLSVGGKKLSL